MARPKVPKSKKHRGGSISLPPTEWDWIERQSKEQGVPSSQVVFDALQTLRGEMATTLSNLRQELADQGATISRLQDLATQQQTELKRLLASQDLVGAIVSPYGGRAAGPSSMPKMNLEKARTVRAVLSNEMSRRLLELRAQGDTSHQMLDIHRDGLKVWGSWEAYWGAVKAALASMPPAQDKVGGK